MDFHELIETHNDFPEKGIKYKDVLPILRSPDNFSCLIENMSDFELNAYAENLDNINTNLGIINSNSWNIWHDLYFDESCMCLPNNIKLIY